MSHHRDDRLVNFLRQNVSSPPPPKVDVEEALMSQIAKEKETQRVIPFPKRPHPQWFLSGVIAASVLLLFNSVRWLQPTPSSPQQTLELEAFLTENWDAVTTPTSPDNNWITFTPEQLESSNRR